MKNICKWFWIVFLNYSSNTTIIPVENEQIKGTCTTSLCDEHLLGPTLLEPDLPFPPLNHRMVILSPSTKTLISLT